MKYASLYTIYGALFGLCFPLIATPLNAWIVFSNLSVESLYQSQLTNPLLWMIDTAPIFLGLFAYLGGVQYDKVLKSHQENLYLNELLELKNSELENKVQERTSQLESNIDKLIQSNKLRTDFIATVSHELRTPLTAMGGAVKLIKSKAVGNIDQKGMQLIELADRNINLLTCLVNDILDMEKLESGEFQFDLKEYTVSGLVDIALNMSQPYADSFQVNLVTKHSPFEVFISVDKRRFIQVMLNLISNACKYAPSGSDVILEVICGETNAQINIADSGSGIPPELEEKLFEKFTQADSSSTRTQGGTGLGLSIAKALVNSMGGEIGFQPNGNQGTVFFVEFPIANYDSVCSQA